MKVACDNECVSDPLDAKHWTPTNSYLKQNNNNNSEMRRVQH